MAEKYEKKSNSELVEILELRSLPQNGKKTDYIERLLEYDRRVKVMEAAQPSDLPEDAAYHGGCFLLYKGATPRIEATVMRIQSVLRKNCVGFEPLDLTWSPMDFMFWEKESKCRSLPALVKDGRIIGPLSEQDLGHIRSWIASDDPMKCIAEAFDREGVEIGESLDARRRGSSFAPELENDNTKGSTMSLLNDSSATSENVR